MYRVEKRFTLPMGHRLSKHKGRCYSIHGHNFTILVGVKAEKLNDDDMVIDFSNLKTIVNGFLDGLDHCLILNQSDIKLGEQLSNMGMRVITVDHDPTAEKFAEEIFNYIGIAVKKMYPEIDMDYVTVFENENSKATYSIT